MTERPLDPGDPATFARRRELDVLVPTRDRPTELTATLAGLAAQRDAPPFGVVVSDQSWSMVWRQPAVAGMVRILRHRGHPVLLRHHVPPRGMAEQRAYLLSLSQARYVLYLDDDVWLEPETVARMYAAIRRLRCGFVGNAPHGLSYVDDIRPGQQAPYEEWDGPVRAERVRPGTPEWGRHAVHSAANLLHVTGRLGLAPGEWRAYKVAWVGGCVLYDRARLRECGGFDFWWRVPSVHAGEDVAAQLAVLDRYGGAGIAPSGAYHLESPTTLPDREIQCFQTESRDAVRPGRAVRPG